MATLAISKCNSCDGWCEIKYRDVEGIRNPVGQGVWPCMCKDGAMFVLRPEDFTPDGLDYARQQGWMMIEEAAA